MLVTARLDARASQPFALKLLGLASLALSSTKGSGGRRTADLPRLSGNSGHTFEVRVCRTS
eukprot:1301411-Alexandrium_andersonii.AAC.1